MSLTLRSLAFLLGASAATAAPVDSVLHAVTVYPDRALVVRQATVDLSAGVTELVFPALPANLWDDSLQVRGSGPAGTTVLDVQSRNVFVEATPSPQIRELEDTLAALRRDLAALQDEAKALENERLVLQQITVAATTVPTDGAAPRPGFDEWRQLLAFHAEQVRRLDAAQRELSPRREQQQAKVAAAEQQLQEARGRLPGRRSVKQVTVRVSSPSAGPGRLELTYTVPGAQWSPLYNARLDSASRQIGLEYQASIINRTGEAWTNVALTLSTARPSAGGAAPEPMPWIVEQAQVRTYEMRAKSPASFGAAEAPAMAMAMAQDSAYQEMDAALASVDSGLTSATFKITAPATIPADGTAQRVAITTLTLPADLRHDSTPKYLPSAFLTAKVRNTSDFPLLPGPLSAFVDGGFIATSAFAQVMPTEEFDLALGVDDAVAIERTLVNRFVEKTGLTNSGTRVTYEIRLDLTNRKTGPASLRLAEPLPVSRHEKIVVKLIEPQERDIGRPDEAGKAFQRDAEGILTWQGTLAAGAKRSLTLKFSIEHPNDLSVIGVE